MNRFVNRYSHCLSCSILSPNSCWSTSCYPHSSWKRLAPFAYYRYSLWYDRRVQSFVRSFLANQGIWLYTISFTTFCQTPIPCPAMRLSPFSPETGVVLSMPLIKHTRPLVLNSTKLYRWPDRDKRFDSKRPPQTEFFANKVSVSIHESSIMKPSSLEVGDVR